MKFCDVCKVALQQDENGNYECYRCGRKYNPDGLVVNEKEAAEANQKLEQDHQVIERLRQDFPGLRCPKCGSDQVTLQEGGFLKKLLGGEEYCCGACGHKWK